MDGGRTFNVGFCKKRRNDNNSLRVFARCYFSATGVHTTPRNRSDLNSGNIDEKECVRGMRRWKATEAYALFSSNHCRRHTQTHTILIHLAVSRFYGAQTVHAGAQVFGSCYCCSPPPSSTISGNVFGGNFSLHTAATGGGKKLNFPVLEVNFSEEHRSEVCR